MYEFINKHILWPPKNNFFPPLLKINDSAWTHGSFSTLPYLFKLSTQHFLRPTTGIFNINKTKSFWEKYGILFHRTSMTYRYLKTVFLNLSTFRYVDQLPDTRASIVASENSGSWSPDIWQLGNTGLGGSFWPRSFKYFMLMVYMDLISMLFTYLH